MRRTWNNSSRRNAYLDQGEIEREMEDALMNRKVIDQSMSVLFVLDEDGEEREMDFRSFANDPQYQDNEAWAYPYGEVDAGVSYEVGEFAVDFEFHIHIEEGKAFTQVNGKNMMTVWLRDPVLGDCEIVDPGGIEGELMSWQGGAAFWFSTNPDEAFFSDVIWDGKVIADIAHAIAERKEYADMMGLATSRRTAYEKRPMAEGAVTVNMRNRKFAQGYGDRVIGYVVEPDGIEHAVTRHVSPLDPSPTLTCPGVSTMLGYWDYMTDIFMWVCEGLGLDWQVCLWEDAETGEVLDYHDLADMDFDMEYNAARSKGAGGEWRDMGDYCVSPSGIEFYVEEFVNPSWSDYDKTVAECMLSNYGEIYVDRYGAPIDNEYDQEEISHAWDGDSVWASRGRAAMSISDIPKWFADKVWQVTGRVFKDFDLIKMWDLVYDADTCLEDAINNAAQLLGPAFGVARKTRSGRDSAKRSHRRTAKSR